MNSIGFVQRAGHILYELSGLGIRDRAGPAERSQQVRVAAAIGIPVGLLFSLFNFMTPGMFALGLVEIMASLLLVAPAVALGRVSALVGLAEGMILLAGAVIFLALITVGGIGGTGLFWVFTYPFLAFFLKGQKGGWRYSLAFAVLVVIYFYGVAPNLSFAYRHGPGYAAHFVLALVFYTLVASAFNLLRSRFEEKLQERVVEKTAVAEAYLEQLQFQAAHDTLTGLPNRIKLLDILKAEIEETNAAGQGLAVCNLRLERLFELGNILGMAGADNLVLAVAGHLAGISAGRGVLARTQRDEFVVIYRLKQPAIDQEELRRFIAERQLSVEEQGYSLDIEFSLGLSIYPDHSNDPQLLLKRAEQAMLQARKNDQRWSIYDEQQEKGFVRHHLLFGKLREALRLNHLQVYYQPQIELASGRVVGAEALTRWNDPAEGMISPVVFIPVAEESGLIRPLTHWLVRACTTECARWHSMGLDMDVSINLSASGLLDPELLEVLIGAMAEAGLPPERVNLEITESCFMTSPERALEVIRQIHNKGFRLSIDDFGTGFSSLSYLKSMPIDELKIDQSFVRNLLENLGDQAIVSSTIDLAHNFGLSVVAEGIEDEKTANWLRARCCELGQGYSFAKPMPADDLVAFVRTRGTRAAQQDVLN